MSMTYYGFLLSAMLLAPFANVVADTTPVSFVFEDEIYFDPVSGKCFDKNGGAIDMPPNHPCGRLRVDWESKHPLRSWECVLKEMPSVKNDIAARILFSDCNKQYGTERTTMRSFSVFGPSTRSECARKYTPGTSSLLAARQIFAACNALYEK